MINGRSSLLDQAPPLPGMALDDLTDDERAQGEGRAEHPCGEFSAARFFALYPERYELIARALAEGFSLECAARVFRIHERTAAAIREREARSLNAEAYRGIQAGHARAVVLAATDELARRLREAPGEIGVRDLVAAVRELHNVERALEGAPTTIAGVIRADGATAALADLLQQAADAAQGRRDGFGRAENVAHEAGRPLVEGPAEVVEVEALDAPVEGSRIPAIDSQSLTQAAQSAVFTRNFDSADTRQDATGASGEVGAGSGGCGPVASVEPVAPGEGRAATGAGGARRQGGGVSTRSVEP